MIATVFNDPQYQALNAMLNSAMIRHQALASNVANINTPGYHRHDISSTFQEELQKAVESGDSSRIRALAPQLETDTRTPSYRLDGNNVNLDREMVEIAKNSAQYEISAALLSKKYQSLRLAIGGR
ncbi:MAG: flagellar basal body rod protein FlgB [Verrucomicrobia bacterium]|nr:flagellar basal body rod protein FlgB [Verrucomicrobiota bacterium]